MTSTNETRPIHSITNDFYSLDIGMKSAILTEVAKQFIAGKRKLPQQLLTDLKLVKKQNKTGEGYDLHMDCKNTRKAVKMYYKQYKHLDKYYPKKIECMNVGSLQRGVQAIGIEKKYENLIRHKTDSHIWIYNDATEKLSWCNPDIFKMVKKNFKKSGVNFTTKRDLKIGDIEWYAIGLEDPDSEDTQVNFGISSLSSEPVYGFTLMFDNKKSRDDYYDYMLK